MSDTIDVRFDPPRLPLLKWIAAIALIWGVIIWLCVGCRTKPEPVGASWPYMGWATNEVTK